MNVIRDSNMKCRSFEQLALWCLFLFLGISISRICNWIGRHLLTYLVLHQQTQVQIHRVQIRQGIQALNVIQARICIHQVFLAKVLDHLHVVSDVLLTHLCWLTL